MKRRTKQIVLIVIGILLTFLLVGPLLIPIPPLQGTLPPQALADPDSQFIKVNNLDVHVKTLGQGEPAIVLLHGFGASLYTWHAVMESLSQQGKVIAFDRPGFGLTERPLTWEGQNPYGIESQVELVIGLLDHFGMQQAILVGNSAGGTVAMQVALEHPERVSSLILVDPAVYTGGGSPNWLRPLLASPQMRRLGPLLARQIQKRGPELIKLAWHDPSQLQAEIIELYKKPLQVENWDKALWEFTLASRTSNLAQRFSELNLPVLVITGDDDRIVPTKDSIRLSNELPNAQLEIIANSGHLPHEERPAEFLSAVMDFITR
jgi:pimeloyl-ACP methyl ester carboxylesterase